MSPRWVPTFDRMHGIPEGREFHARRLTLEDSKIRPVSRFHSQPCATHGPRSAVSRLPLLAVTVALVLKSIACGLPQLTPGKPTPSTAPTVTAVEALPTSGAPSEPTLIPSAEHRQGVVPGDLQVIGPGIVDRLRLVWQFPIQTGAASVAFSTDSRILGLALQSGQLVLWDIRDGRQLRTLTTFLDSGDTQGAHIACPALAFSPDGTLVASTTERLSAEGSSEVHYGGVGVWKIDAAARLHLIEPTWLYVTSVDFSPDGSLIALGTKDGLMAQGGRVIIFTAEDGQELQTIEIPGEGVRDLTFSPDGGLLAVAGVQGRVGLWETADWVSVGTLDAPASGVVFSPDGGTLVSNDGVMWDARTLQKMRDVPPADLYFFSPDGALLAGVDGDLTLFDPSTSHELWHLTGGSNIVGGAFSPDGKVLALATAEGVLNLWGVTQAP
jgi:WD40 repeat protein